MLDYHGNVRHFQFYQHAKSFHTLRWIFLLCFMKFDERNLFFLKFVQPIPIVLAYLVPLDVDVVPIKFYQFLFVPTMFHEVWWKKSKTKLKSPHFLFPWQLRQSLSYQFRFIFAYLVPLDVDVTGNITAKICEAWSEFNIFFTLVTKATVAILTPKSCHILRWIILQSFMKFDERNPNYF